MPRLGWRRPERTTPRSASRPVPTCDHSSSRASAGWDQPRRSTWSRARPHPGRRAERLGQVQPRREPGAAPDREQLAVEGALPGVGRGLAQPPHAGTTAITAKLAIEGQPGATVVGDPPAQRRPARRRRLAGRERRGRRRGATSSRRGGVSPSRSDLRRRQGRGLSRHERRPRCRWAGRLCLRTPWPEPPQIRTCVGEWPTDNCALCTPYNPTAGFSVANAMGRGAIGVDRTSELFPLPPSDGLLRAAEPQPHQLGLDV